MVLIGMVLRALHIPVRSFTRELRGAVAGTVGVVLGSGAVRLLWPGNGVGPLLAGAAAGIVLGGLALRIFARREYGELVEVVGARMKSGAPVGDPEESATGTMPTVEPPHERAVR
jgi:hypothetical protein